jgi:trehalose/maltose hydrolase-like predicted phosphorylase
VGKAAADGFDTLRQENRIEWQELWRGRILITADDDRWQRLADAAFYYLNSSVHMSAPASTSIFGLAQWSDYTTTTATSCGTSSSSTSRC